MAVIADMTRGFNPTDFNGKITLQDIADTVGGGEGGSASTAVTANEDVGLAAAANIQALAEALSARIKALEDAAEE